MVSPDLRWPVLGLGSQAYTMEGIIRLSYWLLGDAVRGAANVCGCKITSGTHKAPMGSSKPLIIHMALAKFSGP